MDVNMGADVEQILRGRVGMGAALLDAHRPGWAAQTDWTGFEFLDCTRCVLGKLFRIEGDLADSQAPWARGCAFVGEAVSGADADLGADPTGIDPDHPTRSAGFNLSNDLAGVMMDALMDYDLRGFSGAHAWDRASAWIEALHEHVWVEEIRRRGGKIQASTSIGGDL